MNWTKTKPTKDGYYWYRRYKWGANTVCELRDGIVRRAFSLHDTKLEELGGEWWGPLEEPDSSAPSGAHDCL